MPQLENPFRVSQPFEMSTDDFSRHWVPHHFFDNLIRPEHCFVYGPAGIGKSTLTRYLMPDLQLSTAESDAGFYGVHVPLRGRSFTQGAWRHLEQHPLAYPLCEHILTSYIVRCLLEQFLDERYSIETALNVDGSCWTHAFEKAQRSFRPALRRRYPVPEGISRTDLIHLWLDVTIDVYGAGHESARRCLTETGSGSVDHAMMSFDDVTEFLRALLGTGCVLAKRFYLLLDDVDDLSIGQALALNYWIAHRLHDVAVIKCTSEGRYPTHRTMTDRRIRDPHDFYQIWLTSVYSRDSVNNYEDFLEQITNRRLDLNGFNTTARNYFPTDTIQDEAVEEFAATIRAEYADSDKEYTAGDKAYRLAESEYIKDLRSRRQLSNYRYSGFSVLADISSNTVRHFLTSASDMFTETDEGTRNTHIPVQVQNTIIRRHAEELVFNELKEMLEDETDPKRKRELEGLERLVLGVGMKCKSRLFSNASERRVFSFAFQDTPSARLQSVLDAGVQYGFFQLSSISDKEGMARRRLYVLSRRVAPFFNLLVKSYSGYLSIKAIELEKMLHLPIEQLRGFCKDPERVDEVDQLALYQTTLDFDEDETFPL